MILTLDFLRHERQTVFSRQALASNCQTSNHIQHPIVLENKANSQCEIDLIIYKLIRVKASLREGRKMKLRLGDEKLGVVGRT